MNSADETVGDRGREVGGEQEGIAYRQRPVAGSDLVAVAQRGTGELCFLLGQELDECYIPYLVETNQDGIVEDPVRQAALHGRTGARDNVKVGQGVAIWADED